MPRSDHTAGNLLGGRQVFALLLICVLRIARTAIVRLDHTLLLALLIFWDATSISARFSPVLLIFALLTSVFPTPFQLIGLWSL